MLDFQGWYEKNLIELPFPDSPRLKSSLKRAFLAGVEHQKNKQNENKTPSNTLAETINLFYNSNKKAS